jgi:hypothetical protein
MKRTECWRRKAFVARGLSLMLIVSSFLPSYSHTASDPGWEPDVLNLTSTDLRV